MKVNDRDVKELINTVNRIHSKVDVIESKLEGLKGCNEAQDKEIFGITNSVNKLSLSHEALKVRVWLLLVAGGTIGGLLGSLISRISGV
jgi:hypothetical protein